MPDEGAQRLAKLQKGPTGMKVEKEDGSPTDIQEDSC